MPITINGVRKQPPVRPPRGRGFDAAITKLAPLIRGLQMDGYLGIHKIAERLNQLGEVAPSGEFFSHTTTRRVLRRLAELGLARGPLSSNASRQHTAKQLRK